MLEMCVERVWFTVISVLSRGPFWSWRVCDGSVNFYVQHLKDKHSFTKKWYTLHNIIRFIVSTKISPLGWLFLTACVRVVTPEKNKSLSHNRRLILRWNDDGEDLWWCTWSSCAHWRQRWRSWNTFKWQSMTRF